MFDMPQLKKQTNFLFLSCLNKAHDLLVNLCQEINSNWFEKIFHVLIDNIYFRISVGVRVR